jgi:hypothetical protein
MAGSERPTLGDFMSTECFRYLRIFGEEAAGRSFIVYAGKQRGISLQDALKGLSADNARLPFHNQRKRVQLRDAYRRTKLRLYDGRLSGHYRDHYGAAVYG